MFSRRQLSFALVFLLGTATALAQQPKRSDPWTSWSFLEGEWVGEGSGAPGMGSGGFSFRFDLHGKILVRRSHADYPATEDRPAFSHEDLMVIYHEPNGTQPRAIYFDTEGHVIAYAVEFSPDGGSVTFLSAAAPSTPRYRLTYTKTGNDGVRIKFEIARPGKPGSFAPYIEASARRKPS